MKKTSILLVDDHAILRMGLTSLIGTEKNLEVVGDAENGQQALQKARQLKPDVILLDLMMHGMDGVETTERLLAENPESRILILTTYGASDALGRALSSGALGAVLKSIPFKELVKAIGKVANGERYVSEEIARMLAANPPLPPLTSRQGEILDAIASGLKNSQIAEQLGIGPDMVKAHVNALCTKLGAANRTEAVAIAMRKHLIGNGL